ncbi:MAG: glycosyltransferase, partial [Bdellovibrionales bacterium]|nr:glycosyltransferase [Bdellovibrionales bacterium]
KYLETPVHSLLSFLDLCVRPVDVVLLCNAANSPFAWIPRLRGMPVAINVDGIERKRAKWNSLGKAWYRLGERCSTWFASEVIADADVIAEYYQSTYGCASSVIRYGFAPRRQEIAEGKAHGSEAWREPLRSGAVFQELGIRPDSYVLYVSRLEPENNAHRVIEAYVGLPDDVKAAYPLVIVGDAPYAKRYIEALRSNADEHVRFAGFRFGDAYDDLQLGARLYVQATEVGGTHPALVEAMGFANCIIVNQTPENSEVIAGCGREYPRNDVVELRAELARCLQDDALLGELRNRAWKRARAAFAWDVITSDYEKLLDLLVRRQVRRSAPDDVFRTPPS